LALAFLEQNFFGLFIGIASYFFAIFKTTLLSEET
jgi:hypothetical protein